jgi:hypothetical protein
LSSLVFKPVAKTSASLRVLTGARQKKGVGEDATDADATAFCTTVESTKSKHKLYIIALTAFGVGF